MPHDRLEEKLDAELANLREGGTEKGAEAVITEVVPPQGGFGRRYRLAGHDGRFLRMNSNGYLGLAHHPEVIAAEENAVRAFGTGPQAVRFISGTFGPHVELERRLARLG